MSNQYFDMFFVMQSKLLWCENGFKIILYVASCIIMMLVLGHNLSDIMYCLIVLSWCYIFCLIYDFVCLINNVDWFFAQYRNIELKSCLKSQNSALIYLIYCGVCYHLLLQSQRSDYTPQHIRWFQIFP